MFLIKCLVCGNSARVKANSEGGSPMLIFFDSHNKDKSRDSFIRAFVTTHYEIKLKCPLCGNEITGQ